MEKKVNVLSNAVTKAVVDSLENMVFMAVVPMRLIWGKVQILSPYRGAITVAFPEKLVYSITGEIHAQDVNSETNKALFMDTVAEMTNTIAGRVMSMIVPEDEEYEISLPKTGMGDIEYEDSSCYIQHFEIEGSMYAVMVEGSDLLAFRHKNLPETPPPTADPWGA